MAGNINVNIIKINLTPPYCIISVSDNENGILIPPSNIGLNLNPDGTANTVWIEETAKKIAIHHRSSLQAQSSGNKITSTINSIIED
jgi:hypothetical protein